MMINYIMNDTIITYEDLSRDFQLVDAAPITLISFKHRIVLKTIAIIGDGLFLDGPWMCDFEQPAYCVNCAKWAFIDNYDYCQKCYDDAYNEQLNMIVSLIGPAYNALICICDKSPTTLRFIINEIKTKLTFRDILVESKYNMFVLSELNYHWWMGG